MSKLAFITTMTGLPWGGSEFLWSMAALKAINEGHQVDCSVYDWSLMTPQIQELVKQNAKVSTRPRFSAKSIQGRIINKVRKTILPSEQAKSPFQPIFDRCPDVICVNQGASYDIGFNLDLYDLLLKYSTPYIIICHFNAELSPLDNDSRNRVKIAFQGASKVLFVSDQNRQLAEHHLAHKIQNSELIQNPVNMQDISSIKFPSSSTIAFASVARLEVSFKGQDILFKILSQPQWQERDWKLSLYGIGTDQAYLEELAKHYKIDHRVYLMGHVEDIRGLWQENHILLMPSHAEGCPISLIEAMLCGRPAVVTDVGGNAECITEAETGFIAESPTCKSFSIALEKAWEVKEEWEVMGIKAHTSAIAKFDKHPAKSLLKIILNLVGAVQ
jgi:L-malate glycosyltransferase